MEQQKVMGTFDFDPIGVDDGELVAGALLIVKTVDADGNPSLHLREDGIGFLERLGMLEATLGIEKHRLQYGEHY